jgi:hypothetical protein
MKKIIDFNNTIIRALIGSFLVLSIGGCGISRVTTTTKGAVEKALIDDSIVKAIESLNFKVVGGKMNSLVGRSFYISKITSPMTTEVNQIDFQYSQFKGHITSYLLNRGLYLATNTKKAQIIAIPTVHFANIDDNQFTIGLPSIPVPVPSVGTMSTPELPLFGGYTQFGRAKVSLLLVNKDKGELLAQAESDISESVYKRWKFLLFFGWRTTTLAEPF